MGTLEDLVCGGNEDFAMTNESHLPVIRQITAGLNQLHSLGIVHGNLKPTNILVSFPKGDTNEPMMKLADFGIRRAVRDKATGFTQFRFFTTEGWMCPTDSQDPIQTSFDLFSLGCVCGCIALNGLHPFGTDPISGIRNRRITLNLSQMQGRIQSHSFIDLIIQMLNFDASKRPSSFNVLRHSIFKQFQVSNHQQMPELISCFSSSSPTLPFHGSSSTGTPDAVEPQTVSDR